jgi:hypothetical protein
MGGQPPAEPERLRQDGGQVEGGHAHFRRSAELPVASWRQSTCGHYSDANTFSFKRILTPRDFLTLIHRRRYPFILIYTEKTGIYFLFSQFRCMARALGINAAMASSLPIKYDISQVIRVRLGRRMQIRK